MVITCRGVPPRWLTDGLVPPAPESCSPGRTLRIGQTDGLEGKVERTRLWWTGVVMKERIRRLEQLLWTLFLLWIYCKVEDQNVNLAICNFWSQGKAVGRAFQTLAIDGRFLWSFSERSHLICKVFWINSPKGSLLPKFSVFRPCLLLPAGRLRFGVSLSTDSPPY